MILMVNFIGNLQSQSDVYLSGGLGVTYTVIKGHLDLRNYCIANNFLNKQYFEWKQ